ncbi:PspA/IM30 family protein [Mycobacterium sp. smrl_JER01]|uniref:PspA/IM30 family protein n=1 Tax=Mycobacterium sp. smrl_JER01 TaxID=3402633 RepID=UPI003AD4372E
MPDVPSPEPDPGDAPDGSYSGDGAYSSGGVPTFDAVREKIETRYATSLGSAELASETPQGRAVEEQYDARQRAAAERLAQIREAMTADRPDDQ